MVKINHLDDNLNIEGKRVLLRVDFNVPTNNGSITETSRIKKVLPTIKFLINKKAKIIIISHIGRPKGKIVPGLTLKPIAKKLSHYLNQNVVFLSETIGLKVIQNSKKIPNGEILLLENLRFNKEEELNTQSFAKELSKIGDMYINEAFSCSHRAHTSVCEITKHIDSFAGKQLVEEVNTIEMLVSGAKKPVTCIIGGSKISTKIGVLNNLVKKMQNIAIVGAMANIFIKHKGYNIGKSIFEKNQENLIENIIQESKKNNCNLVLPEDVIASKNHNSKGVLKSIDQINDNDLILDIGEKTLQNIFKLIDNKIDFVQVEHEMLERWKADNTFDQLREKNKGGKPWSFLDGPITANNPMGVHHAWGRTLKDIFQRYHAMRGHELRYQNGFDCQS